MTRRVLVTGGAGFIGSHTVDLLLKHGYSVRVFDKLISQVHQGREGVSLPSEVEFIRGDVVNRDSLRAALIGVDAVLHLAAEVGVGQSMYEIARYVHANTGGTALLLDVLVNEPNDVQRVVVASSMSAYGEGAYRCEVHGKVFPGLRNDEQLRSGAWEARCPHCGKELAPIPTPETKPFFPTSVYAVSKMDQELLTLLIADTARFSAVALRYFNTYGPGQALSNPYTGVAAIFSSRLSNGRPPLVFEDGQQKRDFIHVEDVARANLMALESDLAGVALNIGAGDPRSIVDVAHHLAKAMNVEIEPRVTGDFRSGDIRHCWADPTTARDLLGFEAQTPFEAGIESLVEWVGTQDPTDNVDQARFELQARGLIR